MASWRIIEGDCREMLATLPDESVQCCVTSPPYFGLRDYGADGQLGLEATVEDYVATLVAVFREVRRVLRDDGILWLNLGDKYAGSWGAQSREDPESGAASISARSITSHPRSTRTGAIPPGADYKAKDLLLVPAQVALALRADGWWLRAECIWDKPNGMPESATDRPSMHHEHVYMLAKGRRYFYDRHGFREEDGGRASGNGFEGRQGHSRTSVIGGGPGGPAWQPGNGRNLRSVWRVPVRPFAEGHFATYPRDLVERCVLVSSRPSDCVLDPFVGAGTTLMEALRHGRSAIGIELNPEYVEMARRRIVDDAPLLNQWCEDPAPLTSKDETTPPSSSLTAGNEAA